jgi:cytochrome P450
LNGNILPFAHDNDHWRLMRRLSNNSLSKQRLASYGEHFNRESLNVLRTFFASSANPAGINHTDIVNLYILNIMNTILFNKRSESVDDPLVQEIIHVSHEFVDVGSKGVINLFPHFGPMNWGTIDRARKVQEKVRTIWGEGLVKEIVDARKRGEEIDCVANDFLKVESEEFPYESIVQNLFGLTMAGTDTSDGSMMNLMHVLTCFPEVQEKAYAELLKVVGVDRLPEASDEVDLPYLRAVVKESLRFRPPVMMGLPHRSIKEDFYQGYRIPEKTTIIINNYAIHFDEEFFPDPFAFKPERYLTDGVLTVTKERDHFTFGAGRRLCPGAQMAERTMFTLFARLLWAFKIQPPLDENGNQVPYELMSTNCEFFCSPPKINLRYLPRRPDLANFLA